MPKNAVREATRPGLPDNAGPPVCKCPECGSERFGIHSVGGHSYTRRCKVCQHEEHYDLPSVHKKIIYLDQFAISNMMKALDPRKKAHHKLAAAGPWRPLFEHLDRLCKAQVLICPASMFHINESVVSPFPTDLKRMYDQLSSGHTLAHPMEIRMRQVHEQVKGWVGGSTPTHDLRPAWICRELDEWQERLIISINLFDDPIRVKSCRAGRSRLDAALSKVAERWRGSGESFEEIVKEEAKSWGGAVARKYCDYMRKVEVEPSTMGDIPEAADIFMDIRDQLMNIGMSSCEATKKTVEFLSSPASRETPFVRISALLYAALARKFREGRKKPPIGIAGDIDMISSLLPYCDAMLIDNECYAYLNEEPVRSCLGYETRLFCKHTMKDFLSYLDDMWQAIPEAHLAKVKEVYGERWLEPYTGMYSEDERAP